MTWTHRSSRSDFIVGNMSRVQQRVHGWGKEAHHTVRLHISVSPWAFSPDTAFSCSAVLNHCPGFSQTLPGLEHSSWARSLGGPPGQKNAARVFDIEEHNVSVDDGGVDVMLTCHWPMLLSQPCVLQSDDPPNSQEKMPQWPVTKMGLINPEGRTDPRLTFTGWIPQFQHFKKPTIYCIMTSFIDHRWFIQDEHAHVVRINTLPNSSSHSQMQM